MAWIIAKQHKASDTLIADMGGLMLMFLCVCTFSYLESVSAITSTCNTEPVTAGETAKVTCHLGEDVKLQGHDVIVQRYVKNIRYPEVVMHCYWPDDRELGYKCSTYFNCYRTTNVTETVTVALPNAQKGAEGLYYCEVLADQFQFKTCNLSIGINAGAIKRVNAAADDSTTERKTPKPAEEASKLLWIGIGLSLMAVLVGVIVGIFGVAVCVLQKRKSKRLNSKNGPMRTCQECQEKQSLKRNQSASEPCLYGGPGGHGGASAESLLRGAWEGESAHECGTSTFVLYPLQISSGYTSCVHNLDTGSVTITEIKRGV